MIPEHNIAYNRTTAIAEIMSAFKQKKIKTKHLIKNLTYFTHLDEL